MTISQSTAKQIQGLQTVKCFDLIHPLTQESKPTEMSVTHSVNQCCSWQRKMGGKKKKISVLKCGTVIQQADKPTYFVDKGIQAPSAHMHH